MAEIRRVTIDEKFNAEYAKKGLQPSVSSDGRVRNVRTEKRSASNDPYYDYEGATVANFPRQQARYLQTPTVRRSSGQAAQKAAPSKKKKGKNKAKTLLVTATVNAWAMPLYGFVQIPFAVINIVFFGLSFVFFETPAIFRGLISLIVDPSELFFLTSFVLIGYAMIVLFTIGLQYLFAGINPLFGKNSYLKIVALIVALIGYSLPLLNLLPWFWFWTAAINKS